MGRYAAGLQSRVRQAPAPPPAPHGIAVSLPLLPGLAWCASYAADPWRFAYAATPHAAVARLRFLYPTPPR